MKVLVADNDPSSHAFVNDVLEITFSNVKIERALSLESFLDKIQGTPSRYDIILLSAGLEPDSSSAVLQSLRETNPQSAQRVVLMVDKATPEHHGFAIIRKPFSLDQFGEILKKVCAA